MYHHRSLANSRRDSFPENLSEDTQELRRRMNGPQRHRLLHGFPLATAMPRRNSKTHWKDVRFSPSDKRGLLVGVLPHPFCNPTVKGCGFCTFPHQQFRKDQAAALVEHVIDEIEQRLGFQPALQGRAVEGLYFGGGTANLTPAEPFTKLCRRLSSAFDLSPAEVTLEGVPVYFVKRRPSLLDIMVGEIPARHFRISMGIQTFDEEQLRRMGRLAFGTEDLFRDVVHDAQSHGFTVSADLLFNLPGQTQQQMRDDVLRAIDLGLDHLGLYHLVLFRGLGTTWSRDEKMLDALPSNEAAAENWVTLRELLLANGFYQTTLTNFERNSLRDKPNRFIYEEKSFQPDRYEMIGFGPAGISFADDARFVSATKLLNPESAEAYIAAVARGTGVWDRYFGYEPTDLKVFYLTRRLAALAIDSKEYRSLFGTSLSTDFEPEFRAFFDEGLLKVHQDTIEQTPVGMFYADSVAALLAWRRIRFLRHGRSWSDGLRSLPMAPAPSESDPSNSNAYGYM